MLSSQSRELNKFIAQLIIAATKLIVFAEYCENNYHLHEKVFEMRTKMFAFFRESFCLLKTLRGTQQIDTLEITFTVLRDSPAGHKQNFGIGRRLKNMIV